MREGIEMRTDRSEEWLKGGTSFYCLKKRDEKDESERGVVLRGRTWVIKALSDQSAWYNCRGQIIQVMAGKWRK